MGRIECVFFPLIQKERNIKVWFPETSPKYYHPNLLCLKKRRVNVKVKAKLLSVMKTLSLLEKLKRVYFKYLIHFIFIELRPNFVSKLFMLIFLMWYDIWVVKSCKKYFLKNLFYVKGAWLSLLFLIFSSKVRFRNSNEIGLPERKILLTWFFFDRQVKILWSFVKH